MLTDSVSDLSRAFLITYNLDSSFHECDIQKAYSSPYLMGGGAGRNQTDYKTVQGVCLTIWRLPRIYKKGTGLSFSGRDPAPSLHAKAFVCPSSISWYTKLVSEPRPDWLLGYPRDEIKAVSLSILIGKKAPASSDAGAFLLFVLVVHELRFPIAQGGT